jgi:hypothetical protein
VVADLALINGKVITVDRRFSIAQAIAIKGDRIAAVGQNSEVEPFIGEDTLVTDLQGKPVLPGINDAHTHTALFGGTRPPLALDLAYPAVKSIKDCAEAVGEKVKTLAPGEWVRGIGWDEGFLEECTKDRQRHPTRWDLDPVSPHNPVCLSEFSVHTLWLNSKALELAGITEETQVPPGGEIVKDPKTGLVTGILRELAAQGLVMKVVPPWTKAQKRQAILAAVAELNALGITSITEGALGSGGTGYQGGLLDAECISIYNDLSNEGALNVRVGILYLFGEYGANSLKDFQQILPQIGIHSGFGNERLRIGGIKIFADGIPPSKTAWMREEYVGGGFGSLVLPGATDEERIAELHDMIWYAHHNGFQVGVHVTGDRAAQAAIGGFVKAEKKEPKGLRHYFIHADFVSAEDAKRAADHDIGCSVQPGLSWTVADFMLDIVGENRVARQWPYRTLLDAGVHVSGSSDLPCTYPSWLQAIQSAVLRESMATGTVRGPEERITREEAIRMYTWEGAWQDHMEQVKGSLEVGKLADLCILDRDLLTVDAHAIGEIRNLATVLGGKIVYNAGLL